MQPAKSLKRIEVRGPSDCPPEELVVAIAETGNAVIDFFRENRHYRVF
jgi:hypothetical protein